MKKRLTFGVKFAYSIGQMGWSILSGLIVVWLVWFYFPPENVNITAFIPREAVLGVFTIIGLITMLGRLMDAVTDPLIASWSDGSTNPKGRRIPFMAKASVPFALLTVLVFWSPVGHTSGINVLFLTVILLSYYIFFTLYVTPYYALIAELSQTPEDRIDLSTYTALTWFFGYIIASAASYIWPMFENMGMPLVSAVRLTFVLLAALALILLLVPVFVINEKDYVDSKPTVLKPVEAVKQTFGNKNFLIFEVFFLAYNIALTVFQTGNVYYVTVLLGLKESAVTYVTLGSGLCTFLFYPVVNLVSKRIGKKRLCVVGMICLCASYLYCGFLGKMPIPVYAQVAIFAVIVGIGLSIFGVLPNAMVGDIATIDAKKTNESKEGMYYAVQTFMSKLGQMIAMVIFSSLLLLGKDQGHDLGVRLTAVSAAVIGVLALFIFLRYKEEEV